ncbi:MAG: hypothetical protein M0Z75_17260 [Nitrospiraceae bacterium]|nr:hypothetical protein [Nitrospiraceae bacterium]
MRYLKSLGLTILLAAALVSVGGCKKKEMPAAPANAPAPAAAPANAPSNAAAPAGGANAPAQ